MKLIITTFCLILLSSDIFSQNISKEYKELTNKALSAMNNGEYLSATTLFNKAFESNNGMAKVSDRYKCASCWALLGNKDNAFIQLERIATKGKFKYFELLAEDLNFVSLREDERWVKILKIMKKNSEE